MGSPNNPPHPKSRAAHVEPVQPREVGQKRKCRVTEEEFEVLAQNTWATAQELRRLQIRLAQAGVLPLEE